MKSVTDRRRTQQKRAQAHINWLFQKDNGEWSVNGSLFEICYAGLFFEDLRYAGGAEQMFVFFADERWNDDTRMWTDWVLNRSPFADAFITKDVKEAETLGVEIDVDVNLFMSKAGISTLRHPFEWGYTYCWADMRRLGFSEVESYALAQCVMINMDKTKLNRPTGYQDHRVITTDRPFSHYEGKAYKPVNEDHTIRDYENVGGLQNSWGSTSENYRDLDYFLNRVDEKYPLDGRRKRYYVEQCSFTKENAEKILKYLKGL